MKNDKLKKVIVKDTTFSIMAFTLLILGQQLIALPFIAKQVSTNEFGNILTLFGVANIISSVFGSSIGDLRLIMYKKYDSLEIKGDFKILLLFSFLTTSTLSIIFSVFIFPENNLTNIILFVLLCCLTMGRLYFMAEYRERKEFFKILKQSIMFLTGMFIGLPIYLKFNRYWPVPFIAAEMVALTYTLRQTSLFSEPFKLTPLVKESVKTALQLGTNTGITYSLSYFDRLIINPILGGQSVGVYYASSFMSKIGGLVLNPLSGVMLGWFSDINQEHRKNICRKASFISFVIGSIYFVLTIIISPYVIKLLYPKLYEEAMNIYIYACLLGAISASTSIIKPVIMMFFSPKVLTNSYILYGVIYVILGFFMVLNYGLIGFAIAGIISTFILYVLLQLIILEFSVIPVQRY